MSPFGIAVIGCGNISKQYLRNLTAFPDVRVVFCADIDAHAATTHRASASEPISWDPWQQLHGWRA